MSTGDGTAIQAAIMSGLSERCEPMEGLLESSELVQPVPHQLSRDFFEKHKRLGQENRITSFGTRND